MKILGILISLIIISSCGQENQNPSTNTQTNKESYSIPSKPGTVDFHEFCEMGSKYSVNTPISTYNSLAKDYLRKNKFKNQYEIYFGLALNEGKYAIQMKDLNNAMTSIFDNNSYSNKSGDTGMFITNCVDYLNNKIF